MILQHNTGLTVGDFTDILKVDSQKTIFRVGDAVQKTTSNAGETAYLFLSANDTKTITMPLGYSDADTIRLIGQASGTLKMVLTHPTLGAQTMLLKGGGVSICSRITSITVTEMEGTSASFTWSIMQTTTANSEDFQ